MRQRASGGCGCSFPVLLFFIFFVLKLTGTIAWSWWWVTSPLWLPAALAAVGVAVLAITGVSIYKIVNAVLRRQVLRKRTTSAISGGANGTGRTKDEVVDVEGTEVPQAPGADGPAG
jgi:membrane protein implicated in regulation of membrane protease activity